MFLAKNIRYKLFHFVIRDFSIVSFLSLFLLNIGRVQMKQTQMYICTLEDFILDVLHYLMYKLELRYCVEITLVFIQSQQ